MHLNLRHVRFGLVGKTNATGSPKKKKKGLTKPVILITTHFSPSNARRRQHSHAVSHSHSSSPFEEVATHVQYTRVFFEHQSLVAIDASSSGHSPFLEGSDVAGLRM